MDIKTKFDPGDTAFVVSKSGLYIRIVITKVTTCSSRGGASEEYYSIDRTVDGSCADFSKNSLMSRDEAVLRFESDMRERFESLFGASENA